MAGACKGYRIVVGYLLALFFQCHGSIAFQLPSTQQRSGEARNTALNVLSPRQLQFWEDVEGEPWFCELHDILHIHHLYLISIFRL
jgi:hypothetical protein